MINALATDMRRNPIKKMIFGNGLRYYLNRDKIFYENKIMYPPQLMSAMLYLSA